MTLYTSMNSGFLTWAGGAHWKANPLLKIVSWTGLALMSGIFSTANQHTYCSNIATIKPTTYIQILHRQHRKVKFLEPNMLIDIWHTL